MGNSKVVKNTAMLYIMSFAKLIFPLLTLPYLTRVLSEDSYGLVSYVKSCMSYVQLLIDFGFILSSVKDIVNANGDKKKIGYVAGNTFAAKSILCAVSLILLFAMCLFIDILKMNLLFVFLSFVSVGITAFLADFLFRGIEKMHHITFIYLISKGVSVLLTFLLVKNDEQLLLIPILDIVTNLISVLLSFVIIRKMGIPICVSGIKDCLAMIKDSFMYFLSSVATTAFAALNTVLIGIFIKDLTLVAYWSLCLSITSAIQGLYTPITNSVYPHMIKEKNLAFIHKLLALFMPIVSAGCALCYILSDFIMLVAGGEKYLPAAELFNWFIPILFFSFPAQVYGWPTLGAVGKVKETTASTIIAAVAQVMGLAILILFNSFNLVSLAALRVSTEALLLAVRMYFTYKNKTAFASPNNGESKENTI